MSNTQKTPEYVTIFWDTTVPGDHGWAYNVIVDGEHTSGSLGETDPGAKLATLHTLLVGEFRGGTVVIPPFSDFDFAGAGVGYEARS